MMQDITMDQNTEATLKMVLTKKQILGNVLPKFISKARVEELDGVDTVSIQCLGLPVIFYIPLPPIPEHEDQMASIIVSEAILKRVDISVEELQAAAFENMAGDSKICAFSSIIQQMGLFPEEEDTVSCPVWFISNESRSNGAAAILCKDTIDKLTEKLGKDFVILPSSVHECLAMPYDETALEYMTQMVREINTTTVDEHDQLSDNIIICHDGELSVFENAA